MANGDFQELLCPVLLRIFHSSQKAGDGIAQWKQLLIIGGFTLMI